jgi:hypothetical protein
MEELIGTHILLIFCSPCLRILLALKDEGTSSDEYTSSSLDYCTQIQMRVPSAHKHCETALFEAGGARSTRTTSKRHFVFASYLYKTCL